MGAALRATGQDAMTPDLRIAYPLAAPITKTKKDKPAMRTPFDRCLLVAVAAIAGMLATTPAVAVAAPAASQPFVSQGNAPVNFSGIWNKTQGSLRYGQTPPYLPASQRQFDAERPQDDPGAKCTYSSMPRVMISPYPVEIVQWPDHILMVSEFNNVIRRIWLDRKSHVEDLFPTYQGDSYGYWEGNTLVVHTTGFNGKNYLDPGGNLMSDKMSVVERWNIVEKSGKPTITIDFTFTDPVHYSKPWSSHLSYNSEPGFKLLESVCQDNNRNDPTRPGPMSFTSTSDPAPYESTRKNDNAKPGN